MLGSEDDSKQGVHNITEEITIRLAEPIGLDDSERDYTKFIIDGVTALTISIAANYLYDNLSGEVDYCIIEKQEVDVSVKDIEEHLTKLIKEEKRRGSRDD